jgi:transposase
MSLVQQVTGAARRTIGDGLSAYQMKGLAGLKRGWAGGNSRKLSQPLREAIGQRLNDATPEQVLGSAYQGNRFWSIETVAQAVEQWYGVRYHSRESYRQLLLEAGFSFQQTEGIYRSRPSEAVIAEFEADAEKK